MVRSFLPTFTIFLVATSGLSLVFVLLSNQLVPSLRPLVLFVWFSGKMLAVCAVPIGPEFSLLS